MMSKQIWQLAVMCMENNFKIDLRSYNYNFDIYNNQIDIYDNSIYNKPNNNHRFEAYVWSYFPLN